jgi:hypothetical protein
VSLHRLKLLCQPSRRIETVPTAASATNSQEPSSARIDGDRGSDNFLYILKASPAGGGTTLAGTGWGYLEASPQDDGQARLDDCDHTGLHLWGGMPVGHPDRAAALTASTALVAISSTGAEWLSAHGNPYDWRKIEQKT